MINDTNSPKSSSISSGLSINNWLIELKVIGNEPMVCVELATLYMLDLANIQYTNSIIKWWRFLGQVMTLSDHFILEVVKNNFSKLIFFMCGFLGDVLKQVPTNEWCVNFGLDFKYNTFRLSIILCDDILFVMFNIKK